MKKTKLLVLASSVLMLLTSCGTLISSFHGFKEQTTLLNAPADLKIKDVKSGVEIPITEVAFECRSTDHGATIVRGPGIRMKVKKDRDLEFTSSGITQTFTTRSKPQIGMLIVEGIFSLGAFTAIDLITGRNKYPDPDIIDVAAILANKPQRERKDLINELIANSHPIK